jgi:hypothetical protein
VKIGVVVDFVGDAGVAFWIAVVLGPYFIIYFSLGKGDIAIDDVVFDKYCVYYDGPYGPNATTTQKTTPSKQTTTTQQTTKSTTTPIFTPSPPDDSDSTTVIIIIAICSVLALSVVGFAIFTLLKRRRQL